MKTSYLLQFKTGLHPTELEYCETAQRLTELCTKVFENSEVVATFVKGSAISSHAEGEVGIFEDDLTARLMFDIISLDEEKKPSLDKPKLGSVVRALDHPFSKLKIEKREVPV